MSVAKTLTAITLKPEESTELSSQAGVGGGVGAKPWL